MAQKLTVHEKRGNLLRGRGPAQLEILHDGTILLDSQPIGVLEGNNLYVAEKQGRPKQNAVATISNESASKTRHSSRDSPAQITVEEHHNTSEMVIKDGNGGELARTSEKMFGGGMKPVIAGAAYAYLLPKQQDKL